MILAGDIGGTNTRLALFEAEGGRLKPVAEDKFPSREHAGLGEIVRKFLAAQSGRRVEHACFGIAGPVKEGRCETTNLAWVIDAKALAAELRIEAVWLLNDLEANAYGIGALGPEDFCTLNPGAGGASGNQAVISAGTGLGEAGLVWDGEAHTPFACEGGHSTFSPVNDLEVELYRYLMKRWPQHVSWERVLSGPGLRNCYEFLRDTGRGEEPAWLRDEMAGSDPSAAISKAGLSGRSELASRALDLFSTLYGSEAGNLALKTLATGGVYLGGGIAPKILEKLKGPPFLAAFTGKGRMKGLLEAMPVRVILNDKTALLGAARCAALRAARRG